MNWAYVAGFFDGEGHIGIARRTVNRKTEMKTAQISLTQKDRAVLDAMDSFLKGKGIAITTIRTWKGTKPSRGVGPYHALYMWRPDDVFLFINKVLPYIIVKKKQAEEVHEFLSKFLEARNHRRMENLRRNRKVITFHSGYYGPQKAGPPLSNVAIAEKLGISQRLVGIILKDRMYGAEATQAVSSGPRRKARGNG